MDDEITQEEKNLIAAFRQLGTAPKADSKEDLMQWLAEYSASQQAPSASKDASMPSKQEQPMYVPHTPRLSPFSGSARKDNEATYELWEYEVRCLQEHGHKDSVILDAVHRSLRGEAAHVAMRLGHKAQLADVLAKLKAVFGRVQGAEAVMAQLYNASQEQNEDVAAWGCRLEEMVARAVDTGRLHRSQTDEVLRSRFWHGLRKDLKDRTGHKFDSAQSFDDLRFALRQWEMDSKTEGKERSTATKSVKSAQQVDSEADDLRAQVARLSAQVAALTEGRQGNNVTNNGNRSPYQGGRGEYQKDATNTHGGRSPYQGGRGDTYQDRRMEEQGAWNMRRREQREVTCFRCGEKGHIQVGCRVRLDHLHRPPLNDKGSARGGRQ